MANAKALAKRHPLAGVRRKGSDAGRSLPLQADTILPVPVGRGHSNKRALPITATSALTAASMLPVPVLLRSVTGSKGTGMISAVSHGHSGKTNKNPAP